MNRLVQHLAFNGIMVTGTKLVHLAAPAKGKTDAWSCESKNCENFKSLGIAALDLL